jgi:hypothetical protein
MATSPRAGILLRLPPALKDAVQKSARVNKRSMNAEIEVAVERHVAKPTKKGTS